MSYTNKLNNYQADCKVLLSNKIQSERDKHNFSDYVKNFSETVQKLPLELRHGLDLGIGPGSPNGKYFTNCKLDGCDVDYDVLDSITGDYCQSFMYKLGSSETLPYTEESLDFLICSCVIQHLNSAEELEISLREIFRVLRKTGMFYLMFKCGTHDTVLTHTNSYYREERSFRVFSPEVVQKSLERLGFLISESEILMDDNWIPYCCIVAVKK